MKEIVIIDALRTPIGKYQGKLSELTAVELGTIVTKKLLEKNKQVTPYVKQVIFGNVLQAGNGQNPARQIALKSGLSDKTVGVTINEVCGSGLKAINTARQQILLDEAEVIIAGGTESMTNAPMLSYYNKKTDKLSDPAPAMMIDGLTDAFSGKVMGLTAEKVATQFGVSRLEQDQFAYQSQMKAANAQAAGNFSTEIVPLTISDELVTEDQGIRKETTLEKLATLRTIFKKDGTVTAGNASTINDGAAAVILASKAFADKYQIPYLAILHNVAETGIDPSIMGIAPISAIQQLLERTNFSIDDIDLFEINEAFAASSIVVQQKLGIPEEKVNICGGGISIGHAIGATGARIITTLAHQLKRTNKRYGIASLCIGGGLGLAALIEVPREEQVEKKFYKLTREQRLAVLAEKGLTTKETNKTLTEMTLSEEIAGNLIENQISEVEIPLGVAVDMQVNGKNYFVPLATEEPSVVAACSNGAKMANSLGGFTSTQATGFLNGQIVFMHVSDPQKIIDQIVTKKKEIFKRADEIHPSIVKRGGGLKDISVRTLADKEQTFVSVDFIINTCDAMGANIVNTILEGIAKLFRNWFSEEILFSILSNYAAESIVHANCSIPFASLSKTGDGKLVAEKIATAASYANLDPYRAATHNKGIMNGIHAVVLATGNDTRAVSAAVHAFAAKNGKYQSLTKWEVKSNTLYGEIELPLAIGTVGGAVPILPKARAALRIMKITKARELAEVIASVGLAQNLAALRALVSEGIQQGHMSLQARSLALAVGAKEAEIDQLAALLQNKQMNQETAKQLLVKIRTKK